ncbi:MAG: class I SAM-dependent methyltransferase [Gemmatimonadota bacterium]|nr:class I SAM-dependent methyltransferase [Gemmatimonadota bacterium]
MGGSLQPYFADPACTRIYSIDRRPVFWPDERGRLFSYKKSENSSQTMLDNLARAFPAGFPGKVLTFDCDATELDPSQFENKPKICFIDGEHTDRAAYSDFQVCRNIADRDGIIVFHDADLVFRAIKRAENFLANESVQFASLVLPHCVYAILLNGAVEAYFPKLEPFGIDREHYFRKVEQRLALVQEKNRRSKIRQLRDWLSNYPRLYEFLRTIKGLFMQNSTGP